MRPVGDCLIERLNVCRSLQSQSFLPAAGFKGIESRESAQGIVKVAVLAVVNILRAGREHLVNYSFGFAVVASLEIGILQKIHRVQLMRANAEFSIRFPGG